MRVSADPPLSDAGRRLCDQMLAGGLTLALAPVALITGGLIVASSGWPPWFVQERVGRGGRIFRMIKFRTMRPLRPGEDWRDDDRRQTRIGRWLRRTSLDELPQLLHVLTGRMALVGPRPLPPAYLAAYTPRQARRHEVRPGITGWAQVHGRNETPWPVRLEQDVWYVEHRSWRLDLRILLLTMRQVVAGRGLVPKGQAVTVPLTEVGGGDAHA